MRLLIHHFCPFEISHGGDDDIESIEHGLEGNAFDNIEIAAESVDDDPEKPLFDILPRQGPQSDKTHGVGESVGHGHRAVGEPGEDEPGGCPGGEKGYEGGEDESAAEVCDGQLLTLLLSVLLSEFPYSPSIDGSQRVVDSHACVAIESMAPIEVDVKGGHDDAHDPKGYMRTILEPDVDEPEYRGEGVQRMAGQEVPYHVVLLEIKRKMTHGGETCHRGVGEGLIALVAAEPAVPDRTARRIVTVEDVVQVGTDGDRLHADELACHVDGVVQVDVGL